jgi:hypothetical protein
MGTWEELWRQGFKATVSCPFNSYITLHADAGSSPDPEPHDLCSSDTIPIGCAYWKCILKVSCMACRILFLGNGVKA